MMENNGAIKVAEPRGGKIARSNPSLFFWGIFILLVGLVGGIAGGTASSYYLATQTNIITSSPALEEWYKEKQEASSPQVAGSTEIKLQESSAVIDVVKNSNDAVISIIGVEENSGFFGTSESAGSGFVIDKEQGLVITNKHVVQNGQANYQILTNNGEAVSVDSDDIFLDPVNDIAIIQVQFPADMQIQELELGDSEALLPGQLVIAIGNALGKFDNSVTTGVVSALGRQIDVGSRLDEMLVDVIQTDAAINPGNSGGPLLNSAGQVIGVNTAVAGNAENIGFAIPINNVKVALESFLEYGEIIRPWLGVSFVQITPDLAKANDIDIDYGAYINQLVTDGPADKAGVKQNDIITHIDDQKITYQDGLIEIMQRYQVGEVVSVDVLRPHDNLGKEFEELELKITLEARQASL